VSDYFDRVERQIVQRVQDGAPRSSRRPAAWGYLAAAAAVAVVIVVVGVFLLARGSNPAPTPAAGNAVSVTLDASVINPQTRLGPALDRSVVILRERLATFYRGVRVARAGNGIVVTAPNAGAGTRARILDLAVPGQLAMYDWEADAIAPSGKTVASQLRGQNPAALEISQGSGSVAPGETGAGSMPLKQARALASRLAPHTRCIVLEAVDPSGYRAANIEDPAARFYVLKAVPLLAGSAITHPRESADLSGQPDLAFGFTAHGAVAFTALTKGIAERGKRLSSPGQTFNQHFAIALDGRLLSVPFIDFKQYPDGITTKDGADISGGFTTRSAKDLATILRYGPLPVVLTATG
jgi:hypothetical protein